MFKSLVPLLKSGDLTLHLSMNADGTIRVAGLPKRADARSEASLYHPFSVCGTPTALEQQFPALVMSYQETREELAVQFQKEEHEMRERAEKAAQEKQAAKTKAARSSTAAKGAGATTASQKTGQTSNQKTGQKAAQASGTKTAPETPRTKPARSTSAQASGGDDRAEAARAIDETYLAAHDAAALRRLARDLLPADQQASLKNNNARTLRDKLARFLAESRGSDGQLPEALRTRLAPWQASSTAA